MSPDGGQSSDQPVVSVLNANAQGRVLLVCEHASNHIPGKFRNLGLPPDAVRSHIAWDPGALEVAKRLSASLDAPLVVSNISRLVYDCNRPPDAPDAMPERSEAYEIPGNRNLSEGERRSRIETYYRPFEAKLTEVLSGQPEIKALITVHSFTPVYHGRVREVELGVLHDEDGRLADVVLELAPKFTPMVTRRNQPYGMADGVTHTLRHHGIDRNLLNVMLEIRNDLIAMPAQWASVAAGLHGLLYKALKMCGVTMATVEAN